MRFIFVNHHGALVSVLLLWAGLFDFSFGQFTNAINIPPEPNLSSFQSVAGSTQLNLFEGGEVGDFFRVEPNAEFNVFGGSVGDSLWVRSGAKVNAFGGDIGLSIDAEPDSEFNLFGAGFRLNGAAISGLETIGNQVTLDLPSFPDFYVLSGILSDGSPFVWTNHYLSSLEGAITLYATHIPPAEPNVTVLPYHQPPSGIQDEQVLVIDDNGLIDSHLYAAAGSLVVVTGGSITGSLRADGARVSVTNGEIGDYFLLSGQSTLDMSGGLVGNLFHVVAQSEANIADGTIGNVRVRENSVLNLSGGNASGFVTTHSNSVANISGGTVNGSLGVFHTSTVNVTGGEFLGGLSAFEASNVNLVGKSFILDGVDITNSLIPNTPFTVTSRDVELTGLFEDGTPFLFDLNSLQSPGEDFFSELADLTITLVLPGDLNSDNRVDGGDFLLWQRSLGPTTDPSDLVDWRSNYARIIETKSHAMAVVPELPSLVYLWVSIVAYSALWR